MDASAEPIARLLRTLGYHVIPPERVRTLETQARISELVIQEMNDIDGYRAHVQKRMGFDIGGELAKVLPVKVERLGNFDGELHTMKVHIILPKPETE